MTEIKLVSYSRSFEKPGAPIEWTLSVRNMDFTTPILLGFVKEVATDAELTVRAVAEGKTTWDEDTLVAHSVAKHALTRPIGIDIL